MKKYITTVLSLFCISFSLCAQISVSYSVGYASHKMDDMSLLLDNALHYATYSLPKGVRITDDFPGHITQNLDVAYRFKNHEVGLKGTYMTTGGKIAYADYSGEYYEKLTLNAFRVGAMYRFHFAKAQFGNMSLSVFGEVSPAITFTDVKYKVLLSLPDYNIHETNSDDNISTNETGFSIQPLIGVQLFFMKNIFATIGIGYDFEFGSKLSTTNDAYRADWSGFRCNAGVGYQFK